MDDLEDELELDVEDDESEEEVPKVENPGASDDAESESLLKKIYQCAEPFLLDVNVLRYLEIQQDVLHAEVVKDVANDFVVRGGMNRCTHTLTWKVKGATYTAAAAGPTKAQARPKAARRLLPSLPPPDAAADLLLSYGPALLNATETFVEALEARDMVGILNCLMPLLVVAEAWNLSPVLCAWRMVLAVGTVAQVEKFIDILTLASTKNCCPSTVWEVLLDEATFVIRAHADDGKAIEKETDWRSLHAILKLRNVRVRSNSFDGQAAQNYFLKFRPLLQLEIAAGLRRVEEESLEQSRNVVHLICQSQPAPNEPFSVSVSQGGEWRKDLIEGDIMLVWCTESKIGPNSAAAVRILTRPDMMSKEFIVEFITAESAFRDWILRKHTRLAASTVYPAAPMLRQQQALRALCYKKHNESYHYDPQMRAQLLATEAGSGQPEVTGNPQDAAIATALNPSGAISLIQGPPGTGKTYVACRILEQWIRTKKSGKLLAVADTNVAADNLQHGLIGLGITTSVRVGLGGDDNLQLEQLERHPRWCEVERLERDHKPQSAQRARELRYLVTRDVIANSDILIATCIGVGNAKFDGIHFEKVVVDECTQAVETASLVALARGATQAVLIGDHEQLPPTIFTEAATSMGYKISLFERLVMRKAMPLVELLDQRRMHSTLSAFPNHYIYKDRLRNAVSDNDRPPVEELWWSRDFRCIFVDIGSPEDTSRGSKSNPIEAQALLRTFHTVVEQGMNPRDIGILTPYSAQKLVLKKYLGNSFDVQIDTIDGFQGKEKELILFSSVRSNPHGNVGFLKDSRRMNVMLTRARRGLVVFGSAKTLRKENGLWALWTEWVARHNALLPLGHWVKVVTEKVKENSTKPHIIKAKADRIAAAKTAMEAATTPSAPSASAPRPRVAANARKSVPSRTAIKSDEDDGQSMELDLDEADGETATPIHRPSPDPDGDEGFVLDEFLGNLAAQKLSGVEQQTALLDIVGGLGTATQAAKAPEALETTAGVNSATAPETLQSSEGANRAAKDVPCSGSTTEEELTENELKPTGGSRSTKNEVKAIENVDGGNDVKADNENCEASQTRQVEREGKRDLEASTEGNAKEPERKRSRSRD